MAGRCGHCADGGDRLIDVGGGVVVVTSLTQVVGC